MGRIVSKHIALQHVMNSPIGSTSPKQCAGFSTKRSVVMGVPSPTRDQAAVDTPDLTVHPLAVVGHQESDCGSDVFGLA